MDLAVRKMTLGRFGVEDVGAVHENLPPARLVEASVRRREGMISGSGALVVRTGKRTGRSPKDRFIVENDVTREAVDWGKGNKAFPSDAFGDLLDKAAAYVENLEEIYVVDAYAGADPRYRLNVHVVTEHAWQALFARQLFRRPTKEELDSFEPEWTVISVPGLLTDPEEDATESETFVGIDFERKVVLVCGTAYAGEIKKSIFTVLNFVLPTERDVFPMHCSANVGKEGDVALFFGLSGTGKTTLSADPERDLIGDDEHGWSDSGVFNFEGGCYAKTIDLSPEKEPQIWDAIRFGAVLENVVMDRRTREADYSDRMLTENTRVAHKRPHAFAGRLLLPLRLHCQARRDRGRDGVRGRSDVLYVLRRPVPSPACDDLRRDALREAEYPRHPLLPDQYRLVRRFLWRRKPHRHRCHPRDGARPDRG
jgi:phosphoenolpyruvate carboxykinase (ATP)